MDTALYVVAACGWMVAAAFAMGWWQERDRRLYAEGARRHPPAVQAVRLHPDPGSDAAAQHEIREREIQSATEALGRAARRSGRIVAPEELQAEARRLLDTAMGKG